MNKKKPSARIKNWIGDPPLTGQATPELEEGPYYKPNSPERTRLFEAGIPGVRLTLTGFVFDAKSKPIPHAWLDFWQANGLGEYDNLGYTLRGHQYTDKSGKYILETVVPRGYSVRTPHIHVKVRANDGSPILTTQLFVPGIASNKTDFIYRDDMQMDVQNMPDGNAATFNFVLKS
jgi:protocatechuate 3,4-dioxygenase beta subunit